MRRVRITAVVQTRASVEKDCVEWAAQIGSAYKPDLIIFVAKSGYLFAAPIAEYFHCPMVEITAQRPTQGVKDRIGYVKRLIPQRLVLLLLKSRLNYLLHEKKSERKLTLSEGWLKEAEKKHEKILIVDDSVDTGHTMKAVMEAVVRDYPDAEVKTAAYTVIDYSRKQITVDFWRFANRLVLTATSRKSKEYGQFIESYHQWRNGGVIPGFLRYNTRCCAISIQEVAA